jgi:hypothetical protein
MQFQSPTSEYDNYKYYLATKPLDKKQWHFTNKPFILTVSDRHVVGQFITTMWYNQLCEGENWACEVAIVRVAVNARSEEFKAVKTIMNSLSSLGDGYNTYDAVVLHGILDQSKYRNGLVRVNEKLQSQNVGGAASVNCELNMTTSGIINMTLQGAYNDEKECVTTLTLPVFQIAKECI